MHNILNPTKRHVQNITTGYINKVFLRLENNYSIDLFIYLLSIYLSVLQWIRMQIEIVIGITIGLSIGDSAIAACNMQHQHSNLLLIGCELAANGFWVECSMQHNRNGC